LIREHEENAFSSLYVMLPNTDHEMIHHYEDRIAER